MKLRPYQLEAVSSVFNSWNEGNKSVVGRLATGMGKTIVFADVIKRMQKRALVVCHREELIWQAREKIERVTGYKFQVEMGGYKAVNNFEPDLFNPKNVGDAGVVATIQTLTAGGDGLGRMTKFLPTDFDLLIGDEFHHFTSASNRRMMDYFKQNPNLKILGVTATPNRSDEESLSQIADDVAFDKDMNYGIREGWLVPIEAQAVHIESLDFKNIKLTAGDLNQGQLSAVMESEKPLYGIADSIIEIAGDKRGIGFSPSVNHAKMMADIFNRHRPGCAAHINGKTDKDERKKINSDFANGLIRWIWNCGTHTEGFDDAGVEVIVPKPTKSVSLLEQMCLDCETEILTNKGWRKMDDGFEAGEQAAGFNRDGSIAWMPIQKVVRRMMLPEEFWIKFENPHLNLFVTNQHNLVVSKITGRKKMRSGWELWPAENVLDFARVEIPVAGNQIAPGVNLTDDELRFIGLVLTDGSMSLSNGTVELFQSERCPEIIEYIEKVIVNCGFKFSHKIITTPTNFGERKNPLHKWTICRGKPRGTDKHLKGWNLLFPYLNKDWPDEFEKLTREQLLIVLEAMHAGDGKKLKGCPYSPKTMSICTANWDFANKVQSICVRRGMRCNLGVAGSKESNMVMLNISPERKTWSLTTSASDNRPKLERECFSNSPVWCIQVPSGMIVTRRHGMVAVVGNCGRGTRPSDSIAHKLGDISNAGFRRSMIQRSNKQNCLILEYYGNRYDLATTFDLFAGNVTEDAVKEAIAIARQSGGRMSVTKSLDEEEKRAEEKKKKELEEAARKAKIVVKSTFKSSSFNPFDVLGITAAKPRGWDVKKEPSEKMRGVLRKMGLNPDDFDYAQTKQLVGEQLRRWRENLCSVKQAKWLKAHGYSPELKFNEASQIMSAWQKNGWRPPAEPIPSKVKMPARKEIHVPRDWETAPAPVPFEDYIPF